MFRFIKNIFPFISSKKEEIPFFHEDDYCQREILPVSNFDFCDNQVREIQVFSEKNKCEEGFGWKAVYSRQSAPYPLSSLNISLDQFVNSLCNLTKYYPKVHSGTFSSVSIIPNTIAFSASACNEIFADHQNNIIQNIWIEISPEESGKCEWLQVFEAISKMGDLLLVDWCWGRIIPLKDQGLIEQYIQDKIKRLEEISKEIKDSRNQNNK